MIIFLAISMVVIVLLGCLYYELSILNNPKIDLTVKVTEYDDEAVYVIGELKNIGNKTAYISDISNKLNRKIFIHKELAFVDKLNLLEDNAIELSPSSKKQILLGSIQTISTLNPEDFSDNNKYSEDKILFDVSYNSKNKGVKSTGKHQKPKPVKNKKKKNINEDSENFENNIHEENNKNNSVKDSHSTFDFNLHHELFNEAEKIILNRTTINEKYYRAQRHSNNFINTLSFPDGAATRKLYKKIDGKLSGSSRLESKDL